MAKAQPFLSRYVIEEDLALLDPAVVPVVVAKVVERTIKRLLNAAGREGLNHSFRLTVSQDPTFGDWTVSAEMLGENDG